MLGKELGQLSVTIDLFVISDKNMEIKTISPISIQTGGKVFFYPNFKIYEHSDKLYYDLFRTFTVQRVFDVACRLRSSQGIQTLHYLTPRGKIHTLDFRLPSLNSD